MSIHCKQPQAILENYQKSVQCKAIDKFLNMYDNDVIVYDAWQNWQYKGLNSFKPVIKTWFDEMIEDNATVIVSFEEINIIEDSNLAFVHTLITYTRQGGNIHHEKSINNRFTFCLQKKDNQWKIIHEHSSIPTKCES